MIDALRTLQDAVTGSRPPAPMVDETTRQLTELTRQLAKHPVEEREQIAGHLAETPGRGQALIPPVHLDEVVPGAIRGHVTFGRFYLGGNGAVHGGALPLVFDDLMGRWRTPACRPPATAYLKVNYRNVTPIEARLTIEARLESEQGRKRCCAASSATATWCAPTPRACSWPCAPASPDPSPRTGSSLPGSSLTARSRVLTPAMPGRHTRQMTHLSELARLQAGQAAATAADGTGLTFAQLDDESRRLASLLEARGLQPGDTVAILLENIPRYLSAAWGALRAGLRIVPVNWHLSAAEAVYIAGDSGARALITSSTLAPLASEIAASGPVLDARLMCGAGRRVRGLRRRAGGQFPGAARAGAGRPGHVLFLRDDGPAEGHQAHPAARAVRQRADAGAPC